MLDHVRCKWEHPAGLLHFVFLFHAAMMCSMQIRQVPARSVGPGTGGEATPHGAEYKTQHAQLTTTVLVAEACAWALAVALPLAQAVAVTAAWGQSLAAQWRPQCGIRHGMHLALWHVAWGRPQCRRAAHSNAGRECALGSECAVSAGHMLLATRP